ncbi:MAG: IS66 family transposase [Alphaproteobacteria bacterium CG1_02_46_17]|nr:MAG: IS66 family transposase [Alphaproteobacteria bacterium CG1_02_46_17]
MNAVRKELPLDHDELRAFAKELQAEYIAVQSEYLAVQAELYAKTLHIEKLKVQLATLRRARFGSSSEKIDREIEQLELLITDMEELHAQSDERLQPAETTSPAQTRQRVQPVRRALPDHLPRERVVHDAPCACPECGSTKLSMMGTDEREVLEYVPSQFKVVVHVRPKLSCRSCERITQPAMPSLPIERGLPGPGLLAHVLMSKYGDHLPLHRQSEMFARQGVEIERSTLADWVGRMAYLLEPLAEEIAGHVRAGRAIHADDTPVPVLEPGRGSTRTGRLWVAVRDERPWGSGVPPGAYYRYAPDRKAEQARALLKDCEGFLHADAYGGFKPLYQPHPITGAVSLREVACWAHARRKIYEVHEQTRSPAAGHLLDRIGELFAIEAAIRGKAPAERLAARISQAVPLLSRLKTECEATLAQVSGKSAFAQALRYALTRWASLTRYTEDGRLEISNNAAERAIRPLALGRKNWLFAGSNAGGERAAVIYTLIETARMNGVEPEAYLRTVIDRIADHPMKKIDQLLPWNIAL